MVTSETLKTFGIELRSARTAAGWTLAQLAEEAFGNADRKGYVSQIENGRKQINPLTVGKLAEALDLPDRVTRPMMANDDAPADDAPTAEDEKAAKMIAAAETEGAPGVAEGLMIALAYEYAAGDATDLQSAYKGLRAALETAQDMAARAALPDNTDAGVQAVRAEVQRLNDLGDPEAAGAVIDDLIAQQSAGMAAALELGVQQDRLRNDPKAAADKVMQRVRLEVSNAQLFYAMRQVRETWLEKGRDKGLNFESKVAIWLARMTLDISRSGHERGTAGHDLGVALWVLGERECRTDSLDQAIAAFGAALEGLTRDRMPMEWASTQMNLGNALQTLGERESGTDSLDQAVTAYRAALEERTRHKVPMEWAMTQMNLGTALQALGARESGTDSLNQAVSAFRAALEEFIRDRMPLDWAITQGNLASLSLAFFAKSGDAACLDEADSYAAAALEVFQAADAAYYIAWIEDLRDDIAEKRKMLPAL